MAAADLTPWGLILACFLGGFLFPPFSSSVPSVRRDRKNENSSRLLLSCPLKYALRFYYVAASALHSKLHGLAHNRCSVSELIDEWMSSEMKVHSNVIHNTPNWSHPNVYQLMNG